MGSATVPSLPRMPRFPPAGCGCEGAQALPGGGRRPLLGGAPRVGGVPPRFGPRRGPHLRDAPWLFQGSPLSPGPSIPKSHFPTHGGRVAKGEFGGPDAPPARAPHSGKGPPPLPGAALVYVKNVPFLKRAMADGVGRYLPPASALARPLAA